MNSLFKSWIRFSENVTMIQIHLCVPKSLKITFFSVFFHSNGGPVLLWNFFILLSWKCHFCGFHLGIRYSSSSYADLRTYLISLRYPLMAISCRDKFSLRDLALILKFTSARIEYRVQVFKVNKIHPKNKFSDKAKIKNLKESLNF